MNFSNTIVYECNSCGAKIMVDSRSKLAKCFYCNNQLVLSERSLEKFNITKIIPFNRTEADVKKRIKAYDCFCGEKIKEIKKNYIPFYSVSFSYDSFIRAQTVHRSDSHESFTKYKIDIADKINNKLVTSVKYLDKQILELYDISLDDMQDFDPALLGNTSLEIFDTFNFEESAKKLANFKFMRTIKEYKRSFYKLDEENIVISNLEFAKEGVAVPIYEIITVSDKQFFMVGVKNNSKTDKVLRREYFFHIMKCITVVFFTIVILEVLSLFDLINLVQEEFRIYIFLGYCVLLSCVFLVLFFNKKKTDKFDKIKFIKQK